MLRCALPFLALLNVSACTGGLVAQAMPGTAISVNGIPFTVRNTPQGVTIQNFETGRTSPVILLENAGLAAERVTGCTVDSIIKDGIANTYYATTTCPS